MGLEELRRRLQEILKRMQALNGAVVDAKGVVRAMTDDENRQYEELRTEAAAVKAQIERLEQLEEDGEVVRSLGESTSKPPRVEVTREEDCNEDGDYRGFRFFGEYLQAVARSSVPGCTVDPRLVKLKRATEHRARRELPEFRSSGFNESVGAEGGFLVQTDHLGMLMEKSIEQSSFVKECDQVTVTNGANAVEWVEVVEDSRATGSRHGGVRVYRVKEGETISASKFSVRTNKIELTKLAALAYVTEEMIADASQLESLVGHQFLKEMGWTMDEEVLTGNGNGECEGALNAASLISVAKESGQTADTIVYDNVRKMNARIFPGSESRGKWYIGVGVSEALELLEYTPSGGTTIPVYMPANGIAGRGHGTLYGKPVEKNEHASKLGDLGDIFFADWSSYRVAKKGGIDAAVSQHVRFLYGENTYRWITRFGGKSLWRSALTPAKGTQTWGPIVALAERA